MYPFVAFLICALLRFLIFFSQIGYFLRLLLLRNRLEEGDTFAATAKREMVTLTGAIEHSILPLQDVLKVSEFPRAPGRTPAWQASITWDEEGKNLLNHLIFVAPFQADILRFPIIFSTLQIGWTLVLKLTSLLRMLSR